MANLITTLRLVLLLVIITITYKLGAAWMYLNVLLLIVAFSTDALDGYVARRRGETSEFGAVYDIAADRIMEISLWIVFFDLGYVPLWVVLLFIFRGGLVDAMRNRQAAIQNRAPFEIMNSSLGQWLVGGKFMRIFYAVIKAITFCWLALLEALRLTSSTTWVTLQPELLTIAMVLILMSTLLCVVRGVPVIAEFIGSTRQQ